MAIHLVKPENSICHSDPPIDMVFTYVNGRDPAHLRKRRSVERLYKRDEIHLERVEGKDFNVLYNNVEEITFSVRAVLKYLPWIRKIFIVTDQQIPPIDQDLLDTRRVQIVDHVEILEKQYLPTFNCEVIESCLHRINGLSEIFLYNNDDMMHYSPLAPDAFLPVSENARVGLRLYSYPAALRSFLCRMSRFLPPKWPVANSYTLSISNSYRILRTTRDEIPWWRIIVPKHMTMVFRKSTAERLENELKGALHEFRQQPFRMRGTLSYSTLNYTIEKHWHPHDTVQSVFFFDNSKKFQMFDFNRCTGGRALERLWLKVEASRASFACLNNIREHHYDRFVIAMQRKGLGSPLCGRTDKMPDARPDDV